jgi:hypothetical protein
MLERVCGDYQTLGYEVIEAYPLRSRSSNEDQCRGPLSMYLKAGFEIAKEYEEFFLVQKRWT